MHSLPISIGATFVLTTMLSVGVFYIAGHRSKWTLGLIAAWLALQAGVALSGFYTKTDVMPPRCALSFWPPIILIGRLCCSKHGRRYLDQFNPGILTLLHSVRMLTALVFYCLFLNGAVPHLLTIGGRNPDALAGLTAPLIYHFGYVKKILSRRIIRVWNVIGVGLLLNLVVNAILSGPFPFQQFAFDQPDIAFLFFPYIWMPSCVVPLLLLSHIAALWQLRQAGPTD